MSVAPTSKQADFQVAQHAGETGFLDQGGYGMDADFGDRAIVDCEVGLTVQPGRVDNAVDGRRMLVKGNRPFAREGLSCATSYVAGHPHPESH